MSCSMEHVYSQRSSTHQLKMGAVKEKITILCSEEKLRSQHMYSKSGHSISRPYVELDRKFRQPTGSGQVDRPNTPSPQLDGRSCDGDYDELVKHMSNLPCFLQRVEKENSVQEKALNFGVLEWKRLEKWKYTERMPKQSPKKTLPSTTSAVCSTSGPPKLSPIVRKKSTSHGRSSSSLYSGKQTLPHGPLFGSPPRQQPSHDSLHLNPAKEKGNVSSHSDEKFGRSIKLKGQETRGGGQQEHCDQRLLFNNQISDTKVDNIMKNDMKKNPVLVKEVSLSPSKVNNSLWKKSETQFEGELDFLAEEAPKTIVLPVPNHVRTNHLLDGIQFMESRNSVDGMFSEVAGNRLSDFCSAEEFDFGDLSSEMSHSCPLPSIPSVSSPAIDSNAKSKACQNVNSPISTVSGSKSSMTHKYTSSTPSLEPSNKTPVCIAEKPVVRGRASSPTHRFSFDLGKMGRSFSFKDNLGPSQSNSEDRMVKPGRARPEVRSIMDNHNGGREKEAGPSRGRSSPLKRLFDPLLRHKGPESPEFVRPPNKNLSFATPRASSAKGQSPDRKSEASVLHALFQFTLKSGRPGFKFVVNNSDDMLAAGLKSWPSSGKNDQCVIYTFYSVHEIRKKSMNWIKQGSKSKNCSLGYDIVGQMKISNFHHLKEKAGCSSESETAECVLYSISNPGQADKQALECTPNREVAAIIVKNSIKKPDDGELSGTSDAGGTTIILPGGVHGVPIEGAPSSLITRWKSGGLCDCGGWDVGCKLRVLADQNRTSNVDRLNLFLQAGAQKGKQVFSLKPISNALYSVEFDASVSLLEAFATCVGYVSCRKLSEILDMRSDAENVPTKLQEQVPCPPLSPAGRI